MKGIRNLLKRCLVSTITLSMVLGSFVVQEPLVAYGATATYSSGVYKATTNTQLVIPESGFYRITSAGGTGAYTYGYNNCPEGSNIETHYDRATPGGDGTVYTCVAYIEAGTTLTLNPNSVAGSAGQENSVYANTTGYAYKWGAGLSNSHGKYRITARSGQGGYGGSISIGSTTIMSSKGGKGAMSPFGYVNCGYMQGAPASDPGPSYANGRTFQTSPLVVGCRTFTPYMEGGNGGGTDYFASNQTLRASISPSTFEWVEATFTTGNVSGTNYNVQKDGYASVEKLPLSGAPTTYKVRYWAVHGQKDSYDVSTDATLISSETVNSNEYSAIIVDNHKKELSGYVYRQAQVGNNVVRQTYVLPNGERCIDYFYDAIHTLTFDYNKPSGYPAEMTGISQSSKTILCGNTIGGLPSPSLEGSTFKGWYIDGTPINTSTVWNYKTNKTAKAVWEIDKYNIKCIDLIVDADDNVVTNLSEDYPSLALAPKAYEYFSTARGTDWGTNNQYNSVRQSYYYKSDEVKVIQEPIPADAFDTSGVRSGKTEIITQFDQENFSADDIMSAWDMYPNPNMFVVYQDYIANVVWNYQNGYSIEKIPHDASHIGFNQSFIYSESYGMPHNALEAKVNLHACCAASGLVINYDPTTDVAYLALFCNTTGYGGVNSGYNTKSAIVKVTNFSKIAIKGTGYSSAKDPMYCGTHLVTVNSADIGIPLRAPFDAMQNPASEFKVKVDHDNTTGNVDVYVNDQLAMNTTLPTNLGGGIGLFAGCNGGFHDVNMNIKTTYTQKTNVLYINPNGGDYQGYTEPVGIAGKTISLYTPTKDGYKFNGWVKGKNFKGVLSDDSSKYTFVNTDSSTGYIDCLVATWIPDTVHRYFVEGGLLKYDKNDTAKNINGDLCTSNATGTMPTEIVMPTRPSKIAENKYQKKGYLFQSWNTKSDGTGTTFNVGDEITYKEISEKYNMDLTLYAQWKSIEYDIYYEKGLTDDATHQSIADATRNTNVQSTGSNRPYTHIKYDSNVKIGTIGSVLGRSYKLQFNSNKPASVTKQLTNNTAVPTILTDTIGYLPSKNTWKITGQDSGITTNLEPTMGSTVTQPNYKSIDKSSATATAQWNNKTLNNFGNVSLTGWKFIGWYDNQAGSKSTTLTGTTDTSNVVDSTKGNLTSYTVYPNTTAWNKTLYARWQRTITLTFNMNGGSYRGSEDNVVLTGIYYNNADGYNFNINDSLTPASLPNYEQQQGKIDAYGTYDSNGKNKKYMKMVADGTEYRFIGWSLSPTAKEPDSDFIVYNGSHKTNYRIYDNTTLYAVWEPILSANISIDRTLGNLTFKDGTHPKTKVSGVNASDGVQQLSVIIKPGEQGQYSITTTGSDNIYIGSDFDTKITDIYTHTGTWTDNLNPSTSEDLVAGQGHGLNRAFKVSSVIETRKFYMPQYIGTDHSYATSIGVTQYTVNLLIQQDSYYYRGLGTKEEIPVQATIYIVADKAPDPSVIEPVISVLDELRTKLKIRLH